MYAVGQQAACSGMLFNARTGEVQVCHVNDPQRAMRFLLALSNFKYDGTVVE